MKNVKLFTLLSLLLVSQIIRSQNEANIWYFGNNAGLDFNAGDPVAITDGAMATLEGCATISDANGSLLFYTDGMIVWNKNHEVMENGTGLLGDPSSTQSGVIVPKPGSSTIFYVFTVPVAWSSDGLNYSTVDLSANGGLGTVIDKNILLLQDVTEKVTAVNHANGTDIWVVTHEWNTDAFHAYLVTSTGVNSTAVVSNIGPVHNNSQGYLKASNSGNYLACALAGWDSTFELYDFDNSTGIASNPIIFSGYNGAYGVEFSPDETKLYLSEWYIGDNHIFQVNLLAGTPDDIINSAIDISGDFLQKGALQLGPDEKIYVSLYDRGHIGIIENPNALGNLCNYNEPGVNLGGKIAQLGLPTFIQSYFSANISYQNECLGDTTFFELSNYSLVQSVTWDFGDPASGSNNTSTDLYPYHIFTGTGTYTVTANITLTDGTSSVSSVDVTIFDIPVVTLGNDTTICETDNIALDAGAGFVSYLWNTGATTQTITVNLADTYHVTVSNGNCDGYDTIVLTVQPPAVAFAGSDESVCQGGSYDFAGSTQLPTATNYDSIKWIGGAGYFDDPTVLTPVYNSDISETGSITLSIIAYQTLPCGNDTSSMILAIIPGPVADFTIAPSSSICLGDAFTFTDNSTTTIAGWEWDFGDGNTSIQQNPSHTYNTAGTYDVQLVIVNTDGCNDTVVQQVTVNSPPTVTYSYSPSDSICENELISFTDNSTPTIQSWLWNFDDGNTSTTQNPTHSYTLAGNYNVKLIVTDINSCTDSLTTVLEVNQLPDPVISILPNDTVCANQQVSFSGSDNNGTTITTWNWDFGDGNSGTGQNINHTYTTPGDYTITLNVENNNSCTAVQTTSIHILNFPQSDFTISPNDTSCMGELVDFNATNISGDIVTWDWQFGDGNTASGQNVSHTYNLEGNMTIISTFTNTDGCVSSTTHTRYVQDVNIGFSIFQSPTCQDYNVDFTGTGERVTFTPWNWDFGDGSTSTGIDVSHTYTTAATVDVTLNVCSEQATQQLTINPTCDVNAGTDQATCEDVYFDFSESLIPPSASNYTSIQWTTTGLGYFDDASLITPTYFPHVSEGAIQNDTITMMMVGYGISPCQNDTSYCDLIVIPGAYAQAGSDEYTCFGVPYDFNNSSDSAFATNYATINWSTSGTGSFIDPTAMRPIYVPGPTEIGPVTLTMVAANIINCDSLDEMILTIRPTYEIPTDITVCYYDSVFAQGEWRYTSGTFYDTLQTANYGCDSVIVTNLTVRDKIDKDFTITPGDSICHGELTTFTQTGTATLTNQSWDFGDGNTSTSANPTHTYALPGIYDIEFSYTDDNGCSDSIIQQVTVFELPDVYFTTSMANACLNTSIDFNGTSNSNIVSWDWDFGDGQTGSGQNLSHTYTTWGNLLITLTVTDINGCTETASEVIVIAEPPTANFDYSIILCDSLQFNDLSIAPSGYNLVMWNWDFGDGVGTSTLQNPTYQYPSNTTPGGEVYNVKLIVVADSNGFMCSDSITLPVTVPSLPDIFFTYMPDPTCLGDSTYFYGESGFYIDQWHWDFDDGNYSNLQYPAHQYTATGDYEVWLTITDTNGCVNSLSNVITVNPSPTVSFSMSDTTACHGTEIQFTSMTDPNIAVWYWEFGDGGFSYDEHPIHYFPQGGTYTVSLTVTDSTGCQATATNDVLILPGAEADFTYTNLTCSSVLFTDLSIAPPGYNLTNWHWDFGDGFTANVQHPSHSYVTGIGVYDVTLIVTADSSGYSCQDTITQTIYTPGLPTVFFTWTPEPTMLGNQTEFFGTSGNTITDWYWDFDDGNFATTQDAIHTFATVGSFDVTLTVTDIDGCENTVTHTVTVTHVPELDFSWNYSCEGSPVQFTVESPPTDVPAVVSWEWMFGDGGTSPVMDPIHVYSVAGTYNVSLTIVDTMNATNTVTKQIIVNPLPQSMFSIETPTCAGNDVQFTDYSTTPTGYITEWHWDFGDGNSQVVTFPDDPNVTHNYGTTGNWTVTLTITNSDSCTHSSDNTFTTIASPTASFTTEDGCSSGPVSFTDQSSEDGGGAIVSWLWNFDDPGSGSDNTSTLQNPVHLFSAPGDYTVQLEIVNVNGCMDTATMTITVEEEPTVDFTWSDNCVLMETLFEVDEAVTNVGEVATWSWTFGEGGTSNLQNPTYVYSAPGDYTVTLNIVTTDDCYASVSHTVRVNPLPNPNFESTSPACLNEEVEFMDLSSSPNGLIEEWIWDFGDGNTTTITAPDDPDVTHLYALSGTYAVVLTVTDSEGCQTEVTKNVQVVSSPIADYTYEETCYNDPVLFTDLSTENGGTDIQSWEWFFGDPGSGVDNTSNLQNPSHVYTLPGTYTTTLIIVNTMGCSDTTEQDIVVDSLAEVDFTIEDDSICLGEMAVFTGIGTNIATWFWEFGDGGSSIEPNPSYMYANPGVYTVTLTVTEVGQEECESSVSHEIVVNGAPEAYFEYANTCLGDSTMFTDLSYSQYAFIAGWEWDFGDGGTSTAEDPSHYYQTNDDFLVRLIVTDNFGCTDTIEQWIQVYDSPKPGFSWDQVCDPHGQVNFFDESEMGQDNAPLTGWNWHLDEGYYSTEIDPSYIYDITDTCYTVVLEITDANGCTATDTNYQVCLHGLLEIDFIAETVCEGQETVFYTSYLPQNDSISSYTWNFNDGSPVEITYHDSIVHIFPMAGNYIVELIATDTNECTTSLFKEVTIDSLPTAQFTNTIGSCSQPTEFTDISLGGGEFIESWYWDFGDTISGSANTSTDQNPTHTYGPNDSTYTVKLIVTNFNGCIDSIEQQVYVEPCILADFELPDTTNCAGYELCFRDLSGLSSNNGIIDQWRWDFGDDNTLNYGEYQEYICHVYDTMGTYPVELIVVSTINGVVYQDTARKEFVVHPTPLASIQITNACDMDTVWFSDTSEDYGEDVTSWLWNFGDPTNPTAGSTSKDTSYIYPAYGDYPVSLIVSNGYMCSDTITDEIAHVYQLPTAGFSYDNHCIGYYTHFLDESYSEESAIDSWYWHFGDSTSIDSISTLQNPVHIYADTGDYVAGLIVIDLNMCIDTVYNNLRMDARPTSMFHVIDTNRQGQVYLDNLSSDIEEVMDSLYYEWDFDYSPPGFITSEEISPIHQYEQDGSYTIMLVSTNSYNCPDTTYQQYEVLFTNLFVPNAFVPNGSQTELRTFKPVGINLRSYRLEVYSAWGNLVFESTRLDNGSPADSWDGTYEGKELPTGSYIWRIKAVFEDGEHWKGTDNGDGNSGTSGTITLIR